MRYFQMRNRHTYEAHPLPATLRSSQINKEHCSIPPVSSKYHPVTLRDSIDTEIHISLLSGGIYM